jgi:hypothetical protein
MNKHYASSLLKPGIDDEEMGQEKRPSPAGRFCNELFCSANGLKYIFWVMTAIVTSMLGFTTGESEVARELAYVIISALLAISLTVTLFDRYAYFEHFPISAVLNIGATISLSFFQIGLAAVDSAFTKNRRAKAARGEPVDHSAKWLMDVLWIIVYWLTILTGTVLMQFYGYYWQSGYFTRWGRTREAVKRIKMLLLYGSLVLIIFAGALLYFFEQSIVYQLINAAMIANYSYSMLVLVMLLSHGLSKMPFYLWRSNTTYYGLLNNLERASSVKQKYKDAKIEYHEVMTICRKTSEKHADPYNARWFDKLLDEIPTQTLEGAKVTKIRSVQNLELPPGKVVDEQFIADLRFRHKMSYLTYVRSRATWLEVYQSIMDSVVTPVHYKPEDLKK